MADLEAGFENKAREAFLDNAEARLYNERANLAFEFRQEANERLREYGQENDYDVDGVAQAAEVTDTQRTGTSVSARLRWPHPAGFFETGTTHNSPITGDPLSFVWEKRHDPPEWVREQFEREGDGWRVFLTEVQPEGLPASRFIRRTINAFRAKLRQRTSGGRFR